MTSVDLIAYNILRTQLFLLERRRKMKGFHFMVNVGEIIMEAVSPQTFLSP